jgi:DMSO/TMAO reductase YedYZ molybdopterin-dependent catalytic subunit
MAIFPDHGDRREKQKQARAEGRLPPGQSLTINWPVLYYDRVPGFDASQWDFRISGLVESPLTLSWDGFRALPQTEVTSDFHCVTRWSRLDNRWKGVRFTELLHRVQLRPGAEFVLVLAEEGYTANIPLEDLRRPNVLLAFEHDGQPLCTEHGGPLRLVVPLEKREMGPRLHAPRSRTPGLLGTQRLPRLRRPVERTALLGPMKFAHGQSCFFRKLL